MNDIAIQQSAARVMRDYIARGVYYDLEHGNAIELIAESSVDENPTEDAFEAENYRSLDDAIKCYIDEFLQFPSQDSGAVEAIFEVVRSAAQYETWVAKYNKAMLDWYATCANY